MTTILERVFQKGHIISNPKIYSTGAEFYVLHEHERYTVTFSESGGEIGLNTDGHGDIYFAGWTGQRLKWQVAARRILVDKGIIKWSVCNDGFMEGWEYFPGGFQFCVADSLGNETGHITIYENTLIGIKSNAFFRDANLQYIQDMKKWNWDEAKRQLSNGQLSQSDYSMLVNRLREG